jgi:hypothetical protein
MHRSSARESFFAVTLLLGGVDVTSYRVGLLELTHLRWTVFCLVRSKNRNFRLLCMEYLLFNLYLCKEEKNHIMSFCFLSLGHRTTEPNSIPWQNYVHQKITNFEKIDIFCVGSFWGNWPKLLIEPVQLSNGMLHISVLFNFERSHYFTVFTVITFFKFFYIFFIALLWS